MRLSEHFTLAEFIRSDKAVQLGNDNMPDTPEIMNNLHRLAATMERVRAVCGNRPVRVSSGYRNRVVNKAVGGVANSDHALGMACDFMVDGLSKDQIIAAIVAGTPDAVGGSIAFDQLIDEPTWVHIGINPRWRRELLTARRTGPGGKMVYTPYKPGTPV